MVWRVPFPPSTISLNEQIQGTFFPLLTTSIESKLRFTLFLCSNFGSNHCSFAYSSFQFVNLDFQIYNALTSPSLFESTRADGISFSLDVICFISWISQVSGSFNFTQELRKRYCDGNFLKDQPRQNLDGCCLRSIMWYSYRLLYQSGRKETVLDLAKFVDKGVQVKLTGGRQGYFY